MPILQMSKSDRSRKEKRQDCTTLTGLPVFQCTLFINVVADGMKMSVSILCPNH
jgi:hypothetical protein